MGFKYYKGLEQQLDSGKFADLSASEVAILYALAGFANNESGWCIPSAASIARRSGLSVRTVSYAISKSGLPAKTGLRVLERWKRGDKEQQSNEYDLSFLLSGCHEPHQNQRRDALTPAIAAGGTSAAIAEGGAAAVAEGPAGEAPHPAMVANESVFNSGKELDNNIFPEPMFPEKLAIAWNQICAPAGATAMGRLDSKVVDNIHDRYITNRNPASKMGAPLITLGDYARFFSWMTLSNFLMGKPGMPEDGSLPRETGMPIFVADFYWLFKTEEPINKIRAHYYHRPTPRGRAPSLEEIPNHGPILVDVEELNRLSPLPVRHKRKRRTARKRPS